MRICSRLPQPNVVHCPAGVRAFVVGFDKYRRLFQLESLAMTLAAIRESTSLKKERTPLPPLARHFLRKSLGNIGEAPFSLYITSVHNLRV